MVTTEDRTRIAVLGRIPVVGLSRLHEAARNVAAVLAGDRPRTPVGRPGKG